VLVQAIFSRHGDAVDVIEVKSVPLPLVRNNDVVIRVHAAALNPVDWYVGNSIQILCFARPWHVVFSPGSPFQEDN
jgi:NADPH:quinone reductase-like Zn-dependent oxidoreductase